MIEILGKTNVNFIGWRKVAFAFSGLLTLLGVIALVQIVRGEANLGIDFIGGTSVQLKLTDAVRLEDVRAALLRDGLGDAELQEFPSEQKLLIRVKHQRTLEEKTAERLVGVFRQAFPTIGFVVDSSTEIGPVVGRKLREDAMKAVAVSLIAIICYIALRFEFRFGIAAAIATIHDVLAVLGIFYLMHKEVNILIVTALMTLAGYSLTDTVVVFDRIRENLRARPREPLATIINDGINQVLSRTIVVSLTVVIVLIALLVAGGEVIHDFSLALLIGVFVGSYSSIFVASPLLLFWGAAPVQTRRR